MDQICKTSAASCCPGELVESRGSARVYKCPGSKLEDQEEQQRIEIKNDEVEEWKSQIGRSNDTEAEQPSQSYFPDNGRQWYQQAVPEYRQSQDEDEDSIAPVDDAAAYVRINLWRDRCTMI